MQNVLNLFEHDSFYNFLLIGVYTIKNVLAKCVFRIYAFMLEAKADRPTAGQTDRDLY